MTTPLFKLKDLQGREIALADQRDVNVAVVVFWATWSDHSASVLERLERLYRKHGKDKLSVLAVNVEKQLLTPADLKEMKKMVRHLDITFPVLIDEGLRVFRQYGVVAVPSTVVVDREGVIRGEMAAFPLAGREELFELIEAMAEEREVAKRKVKLGDQPVARAVRYYNLARAMGGRGMTDAMEEKLKKSIASDPNFVLPLILLARLYREQAETEEMIEYQGSTFVTASFRAERDRLLKEASLLVEKALKLSSQSSPVLTEAALVLLSEGKRQMAKERLLEAIKRDPSYTPAHFSLAGLLVREGMVKEGEAELRKALRLNPLRYQGYYIMARAYEERGMEKEAVKAYKKVYQILYLERELFPYSYGR
ncbi:MAG: redoxin domain-containing protein [Candidatus Binatia bacterium]